MLIAQISITLLIAIGLIVSYFILKSKKIRISLTGEKIFAGVLALVFVLRYMWGEDALRKVIKLDFSPLSSNWLTIVSIVITWLLNAATLLAVLYPYHKTEKSSMLMKYFVLFTAIANTVGIYPATIGLVGANAYAGFNVNTLLIGIEVGMLLGYSFITFMDHKMFKVKAKHLWGFLYLIPMLLFIMMPYVPRALFGYMEAPIVIDEFEPYHRIFIYFAFIVPVLIYLVLKNKSYKSKKFAMLYIALATLITFLEPKDFASWKDVTSWPLHLCHTAMYIVPICLMFKLNKVFYFTYFVNVLGAFFAMVMPDTTNNVFAPDMMVFWSNHYFAFFMPLLVIALKLYKRPKLKEFIYSSIAFTVYFIMIVFVNAWFTNYGECDFFFVNSDFIADKLGLWAENLRNITVSFNIGDLNFKFYPLYQALFVLAYLAMSVGMWFLYEMAYTFFDTLADMSKRRKKIKLDELALASQLGGRKKEEPLYMENTNKMILKNFTKIYGSSNVYAVKDANLEIRGGEIFGFLGPNGAGKSTIIKSIVGIQPITDGSIEICGYDAQQQPVMAKKQIGFVPDHYALYEKLTGREYINYIADLYEVSKKDRNERINKYVEIFELQTAFDNQMKTYSHGMKQKIAIMAALVHNPRVWILDEPLTGLDPNSIFQVKECMKYHAKAGNIVFFSSHIIDVVEKICDRIGIIQKGQVQCVKSIKEIEADGTTLEQFYMQTISKNVQAIPVKEKKGFSFRMRKKKHSKEEVEQTPEALAKKIRKILKKKPEKTEEPKVEEAVQAQANEPVAEEPVQAPVEETKSKRGRPAGAKNKPKTAKAQGEKRGRGRPAGSKNKKKPAAQGEKRGRGRPAGSKNKKKTTAKKQTKDVLAPKGDENV